MIELDQDVKILQRMGACMSIKLSEHALGKGALRIG